MTQDYGKIRGWEPAFDFVELARIVRERVLSVLDHADLNEILPQPSSENLALWVWDRLGDLPLDELRVYESPTSFVAYRGPAAEADGGAAETPREEEDADLG